MKNKELQEKRMKGYFIQATKEILKGEGIQSLSVRNISERAGYSYTTLYNYFKDLNDLIFYCVSDFQEECRQFVAEKTQPTKPGSEKLKQSILSYIEYFLEYPGIFELFYLAKVSDFGNKQETIKLIENSLNKVCEGDWQYCIDNSIILPQKQEMAQKQVQYVAIGLLLLYLNRRIPASYSEFMELAGVQLDSTLNAFCDFDF